MKEKLTELLVEYVQGEKTRKHVIEDGCRYFNLRSLNEDSQVYYLLNEVFDDPDDNLLTIRKKDVIQVIENYLQNRSSLEEFQLWFSMPDVQL